MSDNPFQPPGTAPGGGTQMPSQPKPDNYLVYAIISTLCCCLPAGIAAIVYASQVDSKWNAGDFSGAIASSENAKKWCIISLVGGLIAIAVQIGLVAMTEANGGGGF